MTEPSGVHALVRRTHEERVLRVLREHGALTRGEISRHVGLSRTTLSEITATLLRRGSIVALDDDGVRSGRGRPAEKLALDPAAGQLIGIDFGRRRVRVVVSNASHDIVASVVAQYPDESGWEERIRIALDLIETTGEDSDIHFDAVQGVGIGFPGPFSPRMPRTASQPMAAARQAAIDLLTRSFGDRFDAPVIVDNNTRFAALAEAIWDSADPVRNLLYVRLSEGVGGGLVVGGQLVAGGFGFAGEFGHITVSPHSVPCRCGKRGCLETVASIPAIFARCADDGVPVETLDELRRAAVASDPVVMAVLREAGEAVGRVLGSAAMGVNPSEIVIGGEIAGISDVLVQQAAETIRYELLPVEERLPAIRAAQLGDEGGAIGAIAALFRTSPLLAGYFDAEPDRSQIPMRRSNTMSSTEREAQRWSQ